MKIVNEKGKLFGIINIIDLIVLVLLGLLIVGAVQRFKSKPIIVNESTPGILTFEVVDVRMTSVENIKVGDPIYHYDKGGLVGTIETVSYQPFKKPVEYNGQWIDAVVPDKYIISFTVKSQIRNNPDVFMVGNEQIRNGMEYRLKNKSITFFGRVMNIELEQN